MTSVPASQCDTLFCTVSNDDRTASDLGQEIAALIREFAQSRDATVAELRGRVAALEEALRQEVQYPHYGAGGRIIRRPKEN